MTVNFFSQQIKQFKRELLNLKTACDRGLGTATFFYNYAKWTPSNSSQHTIRIQATFQNPNASGMTQLGLPVEQGFNFGALLALNAYPGGAYIDMTASCSDPSCDFVIICSEGMQSLTVTELS